MNMNRQHRDDEDPPNEALCVAEAKAELAEYLQQHALLPCPFCGSAAIAAECGTGTAGFWVDQFRVGCSDLKCAASYAVSGSKAEFVVGKWNRRKTNTETN